MGVPPDGSVDQYKTVKTRRVAKGFYQRYGIDYSKIFFFFFFWRNDYSKMFSLMIEPTFVGIVVSIALKWFDI